VREAWLRAAALDALEHGSAHAETREARSGVKLRPGDGRVFRAGSCKPDANCQAQSARFRPYGSPGGPHRH
jgi:hypothetical protein